MSISDHLNAAGEALKATGLEYVLLTMRADGSFSVGLRSPGEPHHVADCFGHDAVPAVAYVQAAAKLEPKARENEIRDEIERQVRARFDREERKAA